MQRTQTTPNTALPGLRIPPQSEDAEMALLGSIMLRPEAIYEVVDNITSKVFYFEKHRAIYEVMLELFAKSTPIDMLSVSNRLTEMSKIEQIGGASYLAELSNYVPSSANIKYYADIVVKKHMMRTLIEASEFISQLGYDEASDLESLLDKAEKKIFEITNSSTTYRYVELKEALGEAYERFEHLHSSTNELRGVQTGFKSIDNKLSGLQKSDLIILAARPSMGKTSLALDIARQAATEHGIQVCIFSLEMSSQQLTDRMLAAEAFVDSWKLRTGKLKDESDFNRVRDALGTLSSAPIYIDDQPGSNILKMRSVARRVKSEKGLGLIIVDYLQLMTPTNARASDSPVQQVSEISRSLKQLARELDVPVLALSQLSREVEKRGGRPRLSDLRDSGCLAGHTLITRADTGERVPIKDLVGLTNIPVLSMNEDYKLVVKNISKVFSSGVKMLYELKTRSGRTIQASANHPFYTIAGWKRVDELAANQAVVVIADTKKYKASNDYVYYSCRQATAQSSGTVTPTKAEIWTVPNITHYKHEVSIAWNEIASITPLREEEVFDATVPGTHNFVANDFIVHNSIEQDADVVMFIHQEKNGEDSDSHKPRQASIMIEKHRNGPTGQADLLFDMNKARFINPDTSDYGGAEEEFADF